MLLDKDIIASEALAAKITDAGLKLSPVEGTTLHALASLSMPSFWDEMKSATENILETANQFDSADENDHDLIKAHYVKETAEHIRKLTQVTRTVALPLIKEILTGLEQYHIRKAHYSAEESAYKIVQVERTALLDNPMLSELVNSHKDASFAPIAFAGKTILLTAEEIGKVLLNGGVLDAIVEECLKDPVAVDQTVSFFGGMRLRIDGTNVGLAGAILIFLMANSLFDNPPENQEGTLSKWNLDISAIISNVGKYVNIQLTKEHNVNRERLYAYPSTEKNVIYLNGEFYRRHLADGLTPEMVIGNEILERRYKDIEDIIPMAGVLTRQFDNFQHRIKERYEINRLKWSVMFVMEQINKFVKSDALDEERKVTTLARLATVEAAAYAEDLNICEQDLTNRMVCAAIWPDLDVYRMISGIDRIGSSHPNMDLRQILTLFMLDYVTDLTVGQTVLVSA